MDDKIKYKNKYKISSENIESIINIKDFFLTNKRLIFEILSKYPKKKVGGIFDLNLNKIIKITEETNHELYFPFEVIWTKYLWETNIINNNFSYFILSGDNIADIIKNFIGASLELGVKSQYHVLISKYGIFGCKISIDNIPLPNEISIPEYLELISMVAKQYELYNTFMLGEIGFLNNDNISSAKIYLGQINLYISESNIQKLNNKMNEIIKIVMKKFSNIKMEFFVLFF